MDDIKDEVRKTVILPAELDDYVAEQARAHDRSFAAQLRVIIREYKDGREARVPANA